MIKKLTKKKPNLFIVGAPKAGTSFLYNNLKNELDLFFPITKELNFFTFNELSENSYYRDFKIKKVEDYLDYFKGGKATKFRVDTSVSYFTFPNVPKKIHEFNSNSKIIIMVRNPYKRAYSHYLMDMRMGYAKESFKTYISNKDKYSFHYRQYVQNSLYYENSLRFIETFGRDNVLILDLENIENEFNSIYTFLGIEKRINIDFNDRFNANKTPKNYLARFIQKNRNITIRIKEKVPETFRTKFKKLLYKPSENKELNDEDLIILKMHIYSDYSKFKKLITNKNS